MAPCSPTSPCTYTINYPPPIRRTAPLQVVNTPDDWGRIVACGQCTRRQLFLYLLRYIILWLEVSTKQNRQRHRSDVHGHGVEQRGLWFLMWLDYTPEWRLHVSATPTSARRARVVLLITFGRRAMGLRCVDRRAALKAGIIIPAALARPPGLTFADGRRRGTRQF